MQGSLTPLTALVRFRTEVLAPDIWCILAFSTMLRITLSHTADHWCVDTSSGNNHLAFGERRQIVEQITSDTFYSSSNALLVDFVDDAHNTLCLTLAEYIRIEFTGTLTDKAYADPKFSSLG